MQRILAFWIGLVLAGQIAITETALTSKAAGPRPEGIPVVCAGVNQQIQAAWAEHKIMPATTADDAHWLRRVTLDLTGRLPEPQVVLDFLADSSADKRAQTIDRLLASPAYADHWGSYWDNILMGRLPAGVAFIDRPAFREWLRERFQMNIPWDLFVRQLLLAEGYNTDRKALKGGDDGPADLRERYNPAVNWFLRYSRSLPDLSAATSKVFLGVQIQCAQCHDHKTEKWTQKDFKQFTACFSNTWAAPAYRNRGSMVAMVGVNRMELKDRGEVPPVEKFEKLYSSYKDYIDENPKLLEGRELGAETDRRKALADWITAKENPWFAEAVVNRLWGKLMGFGFVEPVDDFRPGNPPVLPETLRTLTGDFVAHEYDLKHLLRAICNSQAYQRECVDLKLPANQHSYWAAYPLKALDIDELFDAIADATDAKQAFNGTTKSNFATIRNAFIQQLVIQMGTDDMPEVTELDETIPRSLMMLNGGLVCGSTRYSAGHGLAAVLDDKRDDAAVIEWLYLRTLSRKPSDAEQKKWLAFVQQSRQVVHTSGPTASLPTGTAAASVSPEIATATPDTDFGELLKHAKTGSDFAAIRGKMQNNADAALYAKAFQAYAAEAPIQALASSGGGATPRQQAFEDMYWALLNCTEFLSNH